MMVTGHDADVAVFEGSKVLEFGVMCWQLFDEDVRIRRHIRNRRSRLVMAR